MHRARLTVLENREKLVEELLAESRQKLFEATQNESKYRETLVGLITQVRLTP